MKKQTRRDFIGTLGAGAAAAGTTSMFRGCSGIDTPSMGERRPNVIFIMTDDQGYGDLGVHGNDKINTPNLDRFSRESTELTQFYVCPVCSPTRACLMTGRYNYRTGVIDTYLGRSMMHPDEVTIAEMLKDAGYETGIFGKWHLGDTYPLRPNEKGFSESLVHNGGGMCQPSDWPGNTYFDPMLKHNNEWKEYEGYCTDIFTDAAIRFIEDNRNKPFFVYLPTNAPHTPLQIADEYVKPYLDMGLDETTAKVYGMVTNIDDNVGKLLTRLHELGLDENTIVMFITDNGPQQQRYTAGLRGRKGSVYDGGIRVPCYVRWPGVTEAGKKIDRIAAHIDFLPTILEACGVEKPAEVALDGKSLIPLIKGEKTGWFDRSLYFQWHRGDEPELYRACAARTQKFKLVNGDELYDMEKDPGEQHNIAADNPQVVAEMRSGYEEWFRDVSSTRGYFPPRIQLGTPFENPVRLTRQDWRGAKDRNGREGWSDAHVGFWEIQVTQSAEYEISLLFPSMKEAGEAKFRLGNAELNRSLKKGDASCTFDAVSLESGEGRIEAWVTSGGISSGVMFVDVKKI